MKSLLTVAFGLFAFGLPLQADAPIGPPEKCSVTSENGRFIVVSDPKTGTKCKDTQMRSGIFGKKTVWTIDQWFDIMFIANDGRNFVTGGSNLMPLNYTGEMQMFTFWANGKQTYTVTLDQVISDKRILERTASHYHWGVVAGFNKDGLLEVRLADGKILFFDPMTGKRAEHDVGLKGLQP